MSAAPFDPSALVGLSDEQIGTLAQNAGFDPQELLALRQQSRGAFGLTDYGADTTQLVGGLPTAFAKPVAPLTAEAPPQTAAATLPTNPDLLRSPYTAGYAYAPPADGGLPVYIPKTGDAAVDALAQNPAQPTAQPQQPVADQEAAALEQQHRTQALFADAGPTMPAAVPGRSTSSGTVAGPSGTDLLRAAQKDADAQKLLLDAVAEKQHLADQATAQYQRQLNVKAAQDAIDKAQWERDYQRAQWAADDKVRAVSELKLDPGRFYKTEDGSTNYGKIFGAALATALGAVGSAFSNQPNYAANLINKAIDDDIASQRFDIASKRQDAEKAEGKVQSLDASRRTSLAEANTYKLQALQDFRNHLADIGASTTDKDASARAAQVDAVLAKQQAEIKHQIGLEQANLNFRNRELAMQEGRIGAAAVAGQAKTQGSLAAIQSARRALAEVEAINRKPYTTLSRDDRAAGETALVNLHQALARVDKAKLSTKNRAIYEDLTGGNPATLGADQREARYHQLERLLDDALIDAQHGYASEAPVPEVEEGGDS